MSYWRATNENKSHTKDQEGEHQLRKQYVSFFFHVIIRYLTYRSQTSYEVPGDSFLFLSSWHDPLPCRYQQDKVIFSPSYYTAAACKSDPHDLSHAGHIAVQVYEAIWGIVFNLFLNQVMPKIQ